MGDPKRHKITAELIEAAKNLKVIGRAGVGYENIDADAATKKGIVVMNTPGGNNVTTGEHDIALMMALARHIPQAAPRSKAASGTAINSSASRCATKPSASSASATSAGSSPSGPAGLRMKVIGFDPFIAAENIARMGVEPGTLDEIFTKSDFITVHVPLDAGHPRLINKAAFAKMKNGVRIINCARGGIVDEHDLADAIKAGKVAGAALDVYVDEPPAADHPLLKLDQVITTPHLGASTDEAQLNVAIAVAEQMVDFLARGVVRYAVNVPSVSPELLRSLAPLSNSGREARQSPHANGRRAAQGSSGGVSRRRDPIQRRAAHGRGVERALVAGDGIGGQLRQCADDGQRARHQNYRIERRRSRRFHQLAHRQGKK